MINNKILSTLIIVLTMISCGLKHETKTNNGSNVIDVAISDFCRNNSRLLKNDNSFHVLYKDLDKNLIRITIIGNNNKFIVENKDSLNDLPNRFKESKEKLFYWEDKKVNNKNDSIYKKFVKFDLIETNKDNLNDFTDDKKKAAIYFFCKDNIYKYKKITSNTFNNIPELKCN